MEQKKEQLPDTLPPRDAQPPKKEAPVKGGQENVQLAVDRLGVTDTLDDAHLPKITKPTTPQLEVTGVKPANPLKIIRKVFFYLLAPTLAGELWEEKMKAAEAEEKEMEKKGNRFFGWLRKPKTPPTRVQHELQRKAAKSFQLFLEEQFPDGLPVAALHTDAGGAFAPGQPLVLCIQKNAPPPLTPEQCLAIFLKALEKARS